MSEGESTVEQQARSGIREFFPRLWRRVQPGADLVGKATTLGIMAATAVFPFIGGAPELLELVKAIGGDLISDRLKKFLASGQDDSDTDRIARLATDLSAEIKTNTAFRDEALTLLRRLHPVDELAQLSPDSIAQIAQAMKQELKSLGVVNNYRFRTVKGVVVSPFGSYVDNRVEITTRDVSASGGGTVIMGTQITVNQARPGISEADLEAALTSYLNYIATNTRYIDPRGIMQTNRQVLLEMDKVYVHLYAMREIALSEVDPVRQQLDDFRARTDLPAEEREHQVDDLMLNRDIARGQRNKVSLDDATHDYSCIVVLGEPGAGKTTLLRYLAYQQGQHFSQAKDFQRLPIYLRIAEYAEALAQDKALPIAHYLATYCQSHACIVPEPILAALLDSWLRRGQCLILLDGFDEITDPSERIQIRSRIEEFVNAYAPSGNRFVVTSRIAGYRAAPFSPEFVHYTILGMTRKEIETFLRQWCPAAERFLAPEENEATITQRADDEIKGIMVGLKDEGVARLAANPMLLTLLTLIHRNGGRLPNRRIELYKLAADTIINRWLTFVPGARRFLSEAEVIKILSPLAYCMHANRPSGVITEGEVYRSMGRTLAAMKGISDLEDPELHTLVKEFLRRVREATGLFVERAPRRYGFIHLTFEEYFAALYLVQKRATSTRLIHRHLHDPRWQEPILLALGYLSIYAPDEAADLLYELCLDPQRETPSYEDLFHRDLLFALRAGADGIILPPLILDKLVDEFLAIYMEWHNGRGKYVLLRQQMNSLLLDKLSGTDIGMIIIEKLVTKVNDSNHVVRRNVAAALSRVGTNQPKAVAALLTLASDNAIDVRHRAVDALSRIVINQQQVLTTLIEIASDPDVGIRCSAAATLGGIGANQPEALAKLLTLAADPVRSVRSNAAIAIGRTGTTDPQAVAKLFELMADPISLVRRSASEALCKLGRAYSKIVFALITLADGDNTLARASAAYVLSKVGANEPLAISTLLTLIRDPDAVVRSSAIDALSDLGANSIHIVEALLTRVGDDNPSVRGHAISVLAKTGSSHQQVIDTLLALNDPDPWVSSRIADALGNMVGNHPEVLAKLRTLTLHPHREVQLHAAASLIRCGAGVEVEITTLLIMLKSANWDFRLPAIQELERRVDDEGQQVLDYVLPLTYDKHSTVRQAAIRVVIKLLTLNHDIDVLREFASKKTPGTIYDNAYSALYELVTREQCVPAEAALCPDINPQSP